MFLGNNSIDIVLEYTLDICMKFDAKTRRLLLCLPPTTKVSRPLVDGGRHEHSIIGLER